MSAPERTRRRFPGPALTFVARDMRYGVILPLALAATLVVAVLATRPGTMDGISGNQAPPVPAAQGVPARSAAAMVAQDPMHSLLTEPDRVREERKRYLAAMDAAYRVEQIDPEWANAAEQALVEVSRGAALAEAGVAPDAWTAQCRMRSCKITAVFGDYDDAQDWANFFLTGTGGTLAQAELSVQRGADSATHVLIFGARR